MVRYLEVGGTWQSDTGVSISIRYTCPDVCDAVACQSQDQAAQSGHCWQQEATSDFDSSSIVDAYFPVYGWRTASVQRDSYGTPTTMVWSHGPTWTFAPTDPPPLPQPPPSPSPLPPRPSPPPQPPTLSPWPPPAPLRPPFPPWPPPGPPAHPSILLFDDPAHEISPVNMTPVSENVAERFTRNRDIEASRGIFDRMSRMAIAAFISLITIVGCAATASPKSCACGYGTGIVETSATSCHMKASFSPPHVPLPLVVSPPPPPLLPMASQRSRVEDLTIGGRLATPTLQAVATRYTRYADR